MRLIVVCNNIPDTVQEMFTELGYTKIFHNSVNAPLKKEIKAEVIFLLSFSDFKRNLTRLNSTEFEKKTIVLFCPIVKAKYLTHAHFLDVNADKTMYSITSEYKNPSLETLKKWMDKPYKTKKVKEADIEFRFLMIEGVKEGSLLNPLMTLLYSLKSEASVKIKEMILSWLVSKDSLKSFTKKLEAEYQWGTISSKFCAQLMELLSSDLGKSYKTTFSIIHDLKEKGEKVNIPSVAKKQGVDDYEIRYIMNNLIAGRTHKLDGKSIAKIHTDQKLQRAMKKAAEEEQKSED